LLAADQYIFLNSAQKKGLILFTAEQKREVSLANTIKLVFVVACHIEKYLPLKISLKTEEEILFCKQKLYLF
jgi:hypothetical protein